MVESLEPIQSEYKRIIKEKSYLNNILEKGKVKVIGIASDTIDSVKRNMGLK